MAKIIKSPSSEVYHIKALMPYWDDYNEGISEKSPYRVIAIRPSMPLSELGVAVLSVFEFDYDHMFGFYDNVKRYYASKVSYEDPQLIAHSEEYKGFSRGKINTQVLSIDDHHAMDIFTRRGKKWLMLFDYGDKWEFLLTLEKKVDVDIKKEYPEVVESKYDAPEQYPDYEEEED